MKKGLLLYETRDWRRYKRIVDIFDNYWADGKTYIKQKPHGKVYGVYAYVEKETENRIRQEVKRLDRPGFTTSSFIYDTIR